MHALGDESGLRNLLLSSSRLTFFLVTPCYLLSAVYLEPLISLLTGMKSVPTETWWVGQVLLFAVFSSQLTNGCSKRVLMMCGDERRLLFISISDAVANVILSVILAFKFGVLGVALGTMIPTTLVGWFWVVPLTVTRLKIPWKTYFSRSSAGNGGAAAGILRSPNRTGGLGAGLRQKRIPGAGLARSGVHGPAAFPRTQCDPRDGARLTAGSLAVDFRDLRGGAAPVETGGVGEAFGFQVVR